jgi:hypothetical protein
MTIKVELRDHPIFICGHPKSGTSLVRAILDSHPQLVVYPEETIFFRRFLPQSADLYKDSRLELAERYLIQIFSWNRQNPPPSQAGYLDRDYTEISFAEVRENMRQLVERKNDHIGDILSAAVLAYGLVCAKITPSTQYWVEKSPYNEYFAKQIYTWWPEAKCIHVIRDPRDNYASYRRKHPDWSAEFFSANWNRSTEAGIQNQEQFGDDNYYLIRYEDLVQSPDSSLENLSSFLHIEHDSTLTSPTRAGQQWSGNSMFADQFQSISTSPIGRWVENLTMPEATVIEMMTKPFMHKLGYMQLKPNGSKTGGDRQAATMLQARWRVATWPVRRRLRRLSRD